MSVKGSCVARAAVGATAMIVFGVALSRDAHLAPHEVVWPPNGHPTRSMERWQVEGIYAVCTLMAATLLAGAIREMTKRNPP